MKNLLTIILITFTILPFAVSGQGTNTAGKSTLDNHREEIREVIKTDEKGIIRGYDFGTSIEEIKKTETGELQGHGETFAIYKIALNDKEYADIIYYLNDEGEVNSIGIEFIIKEQDYLLEENLVLDFQDYFTERYGDFTVNQKNDEVWEADNYFVEMGDSSGGAGALEIEIEVYPKKS